MGWRDGLPSEMHAHSEVVHLGTASGDASRYRPREGMHLVIALTMLPSMLLCAVDSSQEASMVHRIIVDEMTRCSVSTR